MCCGVLCCADPRGSNRLQPWYRARSLAPSSKQPRYLACSCVGHYPTGSSRDAPRRQEQGTRAGGTNLRQKGAAPTRLLHDAEPTGHSRLAPVRLGMPTSEEDQSHERCDVPSGMPSALRAESGSRSRMRHGRKLPTLSMGFPFFFLFFFFSSFSVLLQYGEYQQRPWVGKRDRESA
ncbi:hypothetical protein LX36DRAFT_119637 [Colletotrichum falcatum]|nr:hypothetical protein LX36DRAFT_119637 [Colletotrichum falcatum]